MAVDVGVEVNALLLDLAEACQGKHLEAAGIRKDRAVPVHELMESAQLFDQFISGPHMKVVRVGKLHLGADPPEIVGGYGSLDGSHSAHVHKDRRLDRAVDRLHNGPFGTSVLCQNLIFHIFSCFYLPDFSAAFLPFLVVRTYHKAPVKHTEE